MKGWFGLYLLYTCFSIFFQNMSSLKTDKDEFHVIFKGHKLTKRLLIFESRYPMFDKTKVTSTSRLETFKKESRNSVELSEAGFFYCNVTDSVRCYLCGLQIRNFANLINPYEVHFNHNSNCTHVTLVKGSSYVETLKQKDFTESKPISLIKETQDLICVICKSNSAEVLLLPCKHFATCAICTSNIYCCPLCREIIKCFTFVHTG
jgi:hypothetical protein